MRDRHHGGGHWAGFGFDGPDHLAKDIERAVDIGTRTLRSVFGSGFGRGGFSGDTTNSTVLSRAIAPTGSDFKCEGNHFAVCNVNGIRLTRSTFSNNHVNAADVADIDLSDSTFIEQHVNGSSLRQVFGGSGGLHRGGTPVALCDGSVRFLPESTDVRVLGQLATRSGGEVVDGF